MKITDIVNFLTTENVEVISKKDGFFAYLDNKIMASGNNSLEAICNLYEKWKNIKQNLEAGINISKQHSNQTILESWEMKYTN